MIDQAKAERFAKNRRDLGRPTAAFARNRGAEAYKNAQPQTANPYRAGHYAETAASKWWLEGWMKEARR